MSATTTSTGVNLSWPDPSSGPNPSGPSPTGYQIYRNYPSNLVTYFTDTNSYVDNNYLFNNCYADINYQITPYSSTDPGAVYTTIEIPASSSDSVTAPGCQSPPDSDCSKINVSTPVLLGNGQIFLEWDNCQGGSPYNIQRNSNKKNDPSVSTTSPVPWFYDGPGSGNPNFIFTAGNTYTYVITPSGSPTPTTSPPITVPSTYNPQTPSGCMITLFPSVSGTNVTLVWGEYNCGMDSTTQLWAPLSYSVYRVGATSNPVVSNINNTTATDTDVTGGTTYQYYVTGTDSLGNSFTSNTISVTPTGGSGPSTSCTITLIQPTSQPSQVDLSWTPTNCSGSQTYTIYRTGGSGPTSFTPTGGATSYSDTTVTNGVAYTYYIAGSDGANSTSVTVTPGTSPTAPGSFTLNAATVSGTSLVLTWTPSTSATGYAVFRSDPSTPVAQITSTTQTTYTDSAVKAGVTYSYYVVASNTTTYKTSSGTITASLGGGKSNDIKYVVIAIVIFFILLLIFGLGYYFLFRKHDTDNE
jgi:fibronectin type 3 domain-containing protein